MLDSSQPQVEARAHPWWYLVCSSGNSHALGSTGLALLICLPSQFLQPNIVYGRDKSVWSCPGTLYISPGLCFLAGRSQAHGLLAHTQHGMWPTCFCLAPTPAAAQLRGSPGRVKSSPNLMGLCSTHAPSALCGSQREAVSEQPDQFPKQGISSYTSNGKKENLLFYLQQSSISSNLNKYNWTCLWRTIIALWILH